MASNNENAHLSEFSSSSSIDNKSELLLNNDNLKQSETPSENEPTNDQAPTLIAPYKPVGSLRMVNSKMGVYDGDDE
jgi:hypothetical protein